MKLKFICIFLKFTSVGNEKLFFSISNIIWNHYSPAKVTLRQSTRTQCQYLKCIIKLHELFILNLGSFNIRPQ